MDPDQSLMSSTWVQAFESFEAPGRKPTGGSIADAESVLGEDGRTYHAYKEGKYWLPNDEDEQDRLDWQHQLVKILLSNRLACAPIKDPEYVLDIGTGTGAWAIEFAEENPNSHVIGTDLSRIQPDVECAVPNCHFVRDDAEDEWIFDHAFDYIHMKMMVSCFNDNRGVMKQAFDHLRPGGWLEYQDASGEPLRYGGTAEGTAWARFLLLAGEAMARQGRDFLAPRKYKRWMGEQGFVNVREELIPGPVNGWPANAQLRLAGRYSLVNWRGAGGILSTMRKLLLSGGLMAPRDYDAMAAQVRAEVSDTRNRLFMPLVVVYGQKPVLVKEGAGEAEGRAERGDATMDPSP